jgi:uncharacterized protein DUF3455
MKGFTRLAAALAAVAATLGVATVAHAKPPVVPAAIAVEKGHKAYLEAHAVGVQIYSCNGTAWSLVAPRANLYDRRGKLIATHYAGPTWEAKDGSKVVGARVAGVNVDATAIDWLLLRAASTAEGPRGGDDLADTTFIQRIHTTGGLAPAAANCTPATSGTTVEIPYTADYVFWKARGTRCHGHRE